MSLGLPWCLCLGRGCSDTIPGEPTGAVEYVTLVVDGHMNGSHTMLSTHSRDVWDGEEAAFLWLRFHLEKT